MKNMMKWFPVLVILTLALSLCACGSVSAIHVNPEDYLSVSYSGSNGNATALFDFDYADFEYAIMSQWDSDGNSLEKLASLTALESTIYLEPARVENVSNGDTITVKLTLDEEKARELGYTISGFTKRFTVEGLEEPIAIDPFDPAIFGAGCTVDVTVTGISPLIQLEIRNTAELGDPLRAVKYTASNDWNLRNGDTVTIRAAFGSGYNTEGYVLTQTETTLTIEGLNSYITDVSQLSATDAKTLLSKLEEAFLAEQGNIRDLILENGTTLSVTGDLYSNIRFEGNGYAYVDNGWGFNSVTIVPFCVDVGEMELYWWENTYYNVPLTMDFPNVYGYFLLMDPLLDANGRLITERTVAIEVSTLFESPEDRLDFIHERFTPEHMTEGNFAT